MVKKNEKGRRKKKAGRTEISQKCSLWQFLTPCGQVLSVQQAQRGCSLS